MYLFILLKNAFMTLSYENFFNVALVAAIHFLSTSPPAKVTSIYVYLYLLGHMLTGFDLNGGGSKTLSSNV